MPDSHESFSVPMKLKGPKHWSEPGFQYAHVIQQYAQPVCSVWKLKTPDVCFLKWQIEYLFCVH